MLHLGFDSFCYKVHLFRKHRTWQECFPRIEPFYAIKCNDVDPVIRILADMGLSFDYASKIEIQKILDLGVDPSRLIYANTFKQSSFLKFAVENGVSLMPFDCEDELEKIKKEYPEANMNLLKPSFYVGRCCLEIGAFESAIEQSRKVFDIGLAMGFNMHLLDIGGGFPGQKIQNVETNITFEEVKLRKH
ncbi:ornithine decarboxylase-like [Mytilus californianus]|uniref:ornithine decarboxylase-like n=1 Tax=Mytilus californianus TaxID=6549 RepID=UPI0022481798|nr:ornithine decarboxylase-like [Mytilus californianus]